MKLIKEIKTKNYIDYIYENNIIQRVYKNRKVFWIPNSPIKFAIKTSHKICQICNGFCKQECFLEEK